MSQYFVKLPECKPPLRGWSADQQEFIVAIATPRYLFNIGDHVWLAHLMASINRYVQESMGRSAKFEFIYPQDQQAVNDILGECLKPELNGAYSGKYSGLIEIARLLYPEEIKTSCVFDRLGGDERKDLFLEKSGWSVAMTSGLRHAPPSLPLSGMIDAWLPELSFSVAGSKQIHVVEKETYRAPDLVIACNQPSWPRTEMPCAVLDLGYDTIPFFKKHLGDGDGGNHSSLLDKTVFDQAGLDKREESMRRYNPDPNADIVPACSVTQLWALALDRMFQKTGLPPFKLLGHLGSPFDNQALRDVIEKLTNDGILDQSLCIIQTSTSMKSKNPHMDVFMAEAERAVQQGMQVIFIGAPGDTPPSYLKDNMHNWIGETSLAQSMMLLRHPKVQEFISGDSGLAHYFGGNQLRRQRLKTFFLSSNPEVSRAISSNLEVVDLGWNKAGPKPAFKAEPKS